MNLSPHVPMEMLLIQMDLWYATSLGLSLLEAEREALTPYLEDCFGKHLLQIGGPGNFFLFPPKPTFQWVRLSPESKPEFKGPSVRALCHELPFLPESLDIVLLPHVLELVADPQSIVAQSHVVLAPEGRLIVVGFNPWSLWGAARCWMQCAKTLPWQASFRSMSLGRKWLEQQGFVIEATHSLFFRPPFNSLIKLQRWLPLEALGRLCWPENGGVYIIVAKKQVLPLLPVASRLCYAGSSVC